MHVRLGDVLDDDRNVVVPRADRFVVRGGDKPPILVDERDSVHGPQMLVVLLHDFTGIDIILPIYVSILTRLQSKCSLTWIIFLSDMPAKKIFCLSSSGWNLITYGVLPLLNRLIHCPVSVSQSFICRSYPQDKNLRPSFENDTSFTALTWPIKVRRQFPCVYTSHH